VKRRSSFPAVLHLFVPFHVQANAFQQIALYAVAFCVSSEIGLDSSDCGGASATKRIRVFSGAYLDAAVDLASGEPESISDHGTQCPSSALGSLECRSQQNSVYRFFIHA